MSVTVGTTSGETLQFKHATKWHVDESRILHIFKAGDDANENVAAFATGTWESVKVDPPQTGVTLSGNVDPAEVARLASRTKHSGHAR